MELPSLVLRNVAHCWQSLGSSRNPLPSSFDQSFDVETDRILEIGALNISSHNARYAVRYQPSPSDLVSHIFSLLAINYSDFTFLDFGSGKGRVLLAASEHPFARVIGIEFSPELVKIARENIRRAQALGKARGAIDVVLTDVVDYDVPHNPLVCYLYNPFSQQVLTKLANNLARSCDLFQRDIYMIYVQPVHRGVFDTTARWATVVDDSRFVIYKSANGQP